MAFRDMTSLLRIVEEDLMHPKLLSIFDDGQMILSHIEMIMSLSENIRFQQASLEKSKMKINDRFQQACVDYVEAVNLRSRQASRQASRQGSRWLDDIEAENLRSREASLLVDYIEAKNLHSRQAVLDRRIQKLIATLRQKIKYQLKQLHLCVVETREELYQTLQGVVRDIEYIVVEVRILMQKTNEASVVASSTNIMARGESQIALDPDNAVIVGFDRDIKKIIYLLAPSLSISNFAVSRNIKVDKFLKLVESQLLKLQVIPLVGEGGIGKSTLAKRVYEDPSTIACFQIRAWVVVSQVHNLKEMLIGLLRCISPITGEIYYKDNAEIAEQLCKSLMGHKYLIFLDDIWTTIAWDAIQGCFPDNSNGSRILVTTRIIEVAEQLSANPYHMKYQALEDCWELFSRKVFGQNRFVPEEYELIGKRIVHGCGGLPLAVLVIAGLLKTAKESLEIWRDVVNTLEEIDCYNNKIFPKIISLSYNYLPSHLKSCFHYFGVFSEDSDIPVKKLINLWVAEGFLRPHRKMSLEGVAENYLHDLINRSLVQINELSIDGIIKSCKVHDRVHEHCVREAKKENIVCIINDNRAPEASCWLSCQTSHWPITRSSFGNSTPDKIRSFLCFGKDVYLSKCRLVYPCLKLLRVLDLSFIKYSQGMPSGITDLIHLRYLALSTIGSPSKLRIFKLQNLLTLTVTSWMEKCPLQLPNDILGLPQLRHLRVDKRCSQYLPSLVKKNLQTLFWLKVARSDKKPDFRMVPNLKELGIYIEGQLVPSYLESLVYLHQLEKLKFEIGRVERFYLPTGFPPNLKRLTLRYTYLPWKEIDIIGKLQHLEVLKLKDFAFCGSEWEPLELGFRRLKVLLISHSDLKRWNASADHFPVLERLVLRYCWELERVPFDFANIGTLKLIVLESCYSCLVISASKLLSEGSPLRVHQVGTKVELPIIESSGGERFKAPKSVMKYLKKKMLNSLNALK